MQESTPKKDILSLKLFQEIYDDDIIFLDGEKDPLEVGKGPVTKLFQGIKNHDKPPPSYAESIKDAKSANLSNTTTYCYSSKQSTIKTYPKEEQQKISENGKRSFYQGIDMSKMITESEFDGSIKEPPTQIPKKDLILSDIFRPDKIKKNSPEYLLSNFNDDVNEWKGVVLGNLIQVRKIVVNVESLGTLLKAIADKTLRNISSVEFYGCEINKSCYEKICSRSGKRVEFIFHDCVFDDSLQETIEKRKGNAIIIRDGIRYKSQVKSIVKGLKESIIK